MARLSFLSQSFLLGLALVIGGVASCDPPQVGELSTERHAACVEGFDCAAGLCTSPDQALEELGCFTQICLAEHELFCDDPSFTFPDCEDETKTGSTYCTISPCREQCEMTCDNDGDGMYAGDSEEDMEEMACFDDCLDTGEDSCRVGRDACRDAFEQWKLDRTNTLVEFNVCLDACEGDMTSEDCDELELDDDIDNNCDSVLRARHQGVSQSGACTLDPEGESTEDGACNFQCSNLYYNGE